MRPSSLALPWRVVHVSDYVSRFDVSPMSILPDSPMLLLSMNANSHRMNIHGRICQSSFLMILASASGSWTSSLFAGETSFSSSWRMSGFSIGESILDQCLLREQKAKLVERLKRKNRRGNERDAHSTVPEGICRTFNIRPCRPTSHAVVHRSSGVRSQAHHFPTAHELA